MKGHNRLDVRKYSSSKRTENEWNKLSADCVHSHRNNIKQTSMEYHDRQHVKEAGNLKKKISQSQI